MRGGPAHLATVRAEQVLIEPAASVDWAVQPPCPDYAGKSGQVNGGDGSVARPCSRVMLRWR